MKPQHLIRKKFDVDDEQRAQTYGKSSASGSAPRNVFLIGPRGSGKSTLGEALAKRLGFAFVDTDEIVISEAGRTIEELVSAEGWDRFREIERDALSSVCGHDRQVVATGGGIVLLPENRESMRRCGRIFYLLAEPGLLVERLSADPRQDRRPALTTLPFREELAKTLSERTPLYLECAEFILRADAPVEELVTEAEALLRV
jgi:shikimate kinase